MSTLVKNRNGTAGATAPGGISWLKYWENETGRDAGLCAMSSCSAKAEVGAHVIKATGSDGHTYIVPLCSACNQRTGEFTVDKELVRASK
jgi:hypothetical protein